MVGNTTLKVFPPFDLAGHVTRKRSLIGWFTWESRNPWWCHQVHLPACNAKLGVFSSIVVQFFAQLTAWNGRTDTWIYRYRHRQCSDRRASMNLPWSFHMGPAKSRCVHASTPSFTNEAALPSPRHVYIDLMPFFSKIEPYLIEMLSDNKNRMPLALHTGFNISLVSAGRPRAAT